MTRERGTTRPCAPHAKVVAALAMAFVMAALAASCQSTTPGSNAGAAPPGRATAQSGATTSNSANGASAQSVPSGLELIRLFIARDAAKRKAAVDRIESDRLATRVESELDANGFLLLRADLATLDQLLAALGESASARLTALGQPTTWIDLATAQLASGSTLFVAGRPVPGRDSTIRFGLRGWCFPTVESAAARIELRLTEDASRINAITIDPSTVKAQPSAVRSGRAVLEIGPNEALVILETPMVPPDEGDADGPAAALPPTLAALVLDGRPFPDRATVLVLLPILADILPPGAAEQPKAPSGVQATPEASGDATAPAGASEPARPPQEPSGGGSR